MSAGYYNPLLAYGEERAIHDASEAGANGFIVVDLPPEEAVSFREKCRNARHVHPSVATAKWRLTHTHTRARTHFTHSVSYVPLIAPSTTLHRIKFLATIADTFIYVVSKARPLRVSRKLYNIN